MVTDIDFLFPSAHGSSKNLVELLKKRLDSSRLHTLFVSFENCTVEIQASQKDPEKIIFEQGKTVFFHVTSQKKLVFECDNRLCVWDIDTQCMIEDLARLNHNDIFHTRLFFWHLNHRMYWTSHDFDTRFEVNLNHKSLVKISHCQNRFEKPMYVQFFDKTMNCTNEYILKHNTSDKDSVCLAQLDRIPKSHGCLIK